MIYILYIYIYTYTYTNTCNKQYLNCTSCPIVSELPQNHYSKNWERTLYMCISVKKL